MVTGEFAKFHFQVLLLNQARSLRSSRFLVLPCNQLDNQALSLQCSHRLILRCSQLDFQAYSLQCSHRPILQCNQLDFQARSLQCSRRPILQNPRDSPRRSHPANPLVYRLVDPRCSLLIDLQGSLRFSRLCNHLVSRLPSRQDSLRRDRPLNPLYSLSCNRPLLLQPRH